MGVDFAKSANKTKLIELIEAQNERANETAKAESVETKPTLRDEAVKSEQPQAKEGPKEEIKKEVKEKIEVIGLVNTNLRDGSSVHKGVKTLISKDMYDLYIKSDRKIIKDC